LIALYCVGLRQKEIEIANVTYGDREAENLFEDHPAEVSIINNSNVFLKLA
jgi:hypothetical protein